MGRRVGDCNSVDVTVPAGTSFEEGELVRIENFTGFAFTPLATTDTERDVALALDGKWKTPVPAGVASTRGNFLKWAGAAGATQVGRTNLADEATANTPTAATVAQVIQPRNSGGYALVRLVNLAGNGG